MIGQHDSFLDQLPNGWTFDRLKDVVALRNEKTAEESREEDYLELEDIESGTGRILGRRCTLEVESAVTIFRKGDVLFGKLRPYLEKYYTADFDGKCTGEILAFKPERIASRFLFYCLASRWFIERCNALAYGAKMPRVSWPTQLAQFNVPLPPLPEQERIVTFLDASCAAIDAAVTAKRRQLEPLDALRNATITRVVTRGLQTHTDLRQTGNTWMKEVPTHWELVSLKRVSQIQTGLTLGKEYEGPTIKRPYLRVANVQDGHLSLDDVTLIEVPLHVARRVELRPGDVLMTEGGDLDKLGRGTVWSGEISGCLHQNHIFAVRCLGHKLLSAFLAYLTASQYGRDYFEATGKRTTNLASTNSTKVGLFPIPLPSIQEQRAICQFLDESLAQVAQITSGIEAQIKTLISYRKSLIHECVTGQRRVTEADLNRVQAHG
ncbi:MAG: restriction endonuclease subunit S [Candidatus Manganitrophus sp. SB1]|nr:restriction endonuclease subunit S [Candidatus Manganitrophus morganii]